MASTPIIRHQRYLRTKEAALATALAERNMALAKLQEACKHPKSAMRHVSMQAGIYTTWPPFNVCVDCGLLHEEWGTTNPFAHRGDPDCTEIPCISREAGYKLRNAPMFLEEEDVEDDD